MNSSIRRQLIVHFVLFALALGLLLGGVTLLVYHRVEDRNIERRLAQMIQAAPGDELPQTITFVGPLDSAPGLFQERLRDLEPGHYEWEDEDHESHVLLVEEPGTQKALVALVSFPESEATETRFTLALGIGVLVPTILALWLARYLALRIVSPLEELSRQLDRNSLDGLSIQELPGEARPDEIGTLSRALARASRDLTATAERERRFLREASHELRTPITIIQGVSDLLYESVETRDPQTRQRLERLRRSLRRMNTSVLSLLAMARAEHRTMVGDLPPFHQRLEDLTLEARSLAPPGVEVRHELRSAPASATTASMLIVVLSNLARNAAQHTAQGQVKVVVEAHRAQVIDSGPGMPRAILEQLESQGPQPDVGIGLATVQRICRRFGWRLHIECPPQRGTTATIDLA